MCNEGLCCLILLILWFRTPLIFQQAYVQRRYRDCTAPLLDLVARLNRNPTATPATSSSSSLVAPAVRKADTLVSWAIGEIDWLKRVVDERIAALLWEAARGRTPYELSRLLHSLHESGMGSKYTRLHHTFQLAVLEHNIDPLVVLKETTAHVQLLLLQQSNWNAARILATNNRLTSGENLPTHLAEQEITGKDEFVLGGAIAGKLISADQVSLRQLTKLIEDHKQGCLWDVEPERITLWDRCDALLRRVSFSDATAAGNFFTQISTDLARSTAEQSKLVGLALAWHKQSPYTKPELLQNMENRLLLLSVSAEASNLAAQHHHYGTTTTTTAAAAAAAAAAATTTKIEEEGSNLGPAALESIVGRLLDAGEVSKAQQVCAQFSFESEEMTLVQAIRGVAEGRVSCTTLPAPVAKILKTRTPELELVGISTSELLEALVRCSGAGAGYGRRLLFQWKVGQLLSLPWDRVQSTDPYQLLGYLLHNGKPLFKLVEAFSTYNKLSAAKVSFFSFSFFFVVFTYPWFFFWVRCLYLLQLHIFELFAKNSHQNDRPHQQNHHLQQVKTLRLVLIPAGAMKILLCL